jgi:hypothetical protein
MRLFHHPILFSILKKIIIALALIAVGFWVGYVIGAKYEHEILVQDLNIIHPLRDHNASYQFISPLLAYVIPSADQESSLIALKNTITNVISNEKKNTTLTDASMFFYDLNRGRWIGVNERQKYNPASILKVVIMISYFKEAETNANILQKKLTYTADIDNLIKEEASYTLSNLEVGKSYTVEFLIERMIMNSDNGAEILLLHNIDKNSLDAIYNALNIDNPDTAVGDFTISPRAYSLFFRIIYSSTYLNNELSEKALGILSKTTFKDGIVAGLPEDIIVAHKFGEYVESGSSPVIELHDCGIVYYQANPYFLCVMTKGKNLQELSSVIKNISSLVYQNYINYK